MENIHKGSWRKSSEQADGKKIFKNKYKFKQRSFCYRQLYLTTFPRHTDNSLTYFSSKAFLRFIKKIKMIFTSHGIYFLIITMFLMQSTVFNQTCLGQFRSQERIGISKMLGIDPSRRYYPIYGGKDNKVGI